MKRDSRSVWLIILIIFIGLILGSFIGDFLGNQFQHVELLKQKYTIGNTSPLILDLKVIVLTFGVSINLNLMSIIGVILAIILYRKYWE